METIIMAMIIGTYSPQWGHTALAEGFGKLYALRSLPGGSSLCVFDMPADVSGIVTLDSLTPIAEVSTPGEHSCHITILEQQAVVSDYTSGTLSLFDLDSAGVPMPWPEVIRFEGHGPDSVSQMSPHIHSSWVAPDNKTIVVADLGCDKIYRYGIREGRVDLLAKETFDLPAGCGPRHCAFSHDGTRLYVATELSDEVLVYSFPEMTLLQRCLTNDSRPHGGGHIILSPDGQYLYVSSRLENDGIAIFKVSEDGLIKKCGYQATGAHPRHFAISHDGKTLVCAARDGRVLEIFDISPADGSLNKQTEYNIDKPVFVLLMGMTGPMSDHLPG